MGGGFFVPRQALGVCPRQGLADFSICHRSFAEPVVRFVRLISDRQRRMLGKSGSNGAVTTDFWFWDNSDDVFQALSIDIPLGAHFRRTGIGHHARHGLPIHPTTRVRNLAFPVERTAATPRGDGRSDQYRCTPGARTTRSLAHNAQLGVECASTGFPLDSGARQPHVGLTTAGQGERPSYVAPCPRPVAWRWWTEPACWAMACRARLRQFRGSGRGKPVSPFA